METTWGNALSFRWFSTFEMDAWKVSQLHGQFRKTGAHLTMILETWGLGEIFSLFGTLRER